MITRSDLSNLLQRVEQSQNKSSQLFFINKLKSNQEDPPFRISKARISNQLSTAFIDIFKLELMNEMRRESEPVQYDINLDADEYIQYINTTDVSNSRIIIDGINSLNTPFIDTLDDAFFKTIWAYAVKIQFDNEHLIFFRKYSNGKIMKTNFLDAIVMRNGSFSSLDGDVFQIDGHLDAFSYNDLITIFKITNFERIFGYENMYEEAATSALTSLQTTHDFVDTTLLSELVSTDSRKKRKLAAIQKNQLIASMNYTKIKRTITNYNLQIQIDEQNRKFLVDRENVFRFLKALNDDYLRSEATQNRYEATSKRRP